MVAYGTSFPAPGPGGMSDANWRDIGAGWGDGIINDTGVGAFLLTPSSSSRQIGRAHV